MVSCTRDEAVAIDFLTKTGAQIAGPKVKVIMRIESIKGVDVDDFSDWGVNLVNQRHPPNLIQEEVLLEEGMFKMIGQPIKYMENGQHKKERMGTFDVYWYYVDLEETGKALRTIN